ncbi:MAG: hypothetical protein JWP13_413, partial [Candidatus Saccharibacteria bacterium]|nr:hypothetical protein [Candidatus Saccharibacteria bacterium]
ETSMKVYIDGENMRHRLVSVLLNANRIQNSEDYFRSDIRKLVTDALGETPEEISYFTTRIRQPDFDIPERLRDQIDTIQESHRRWIAELTNQGVRVVKAGLLKVHENAPCYHCGRRTMILQEKGVDVRMATEMVLAAVHDGAKTIVVLSSDADMIPALEVVKRSGTKIIYMCFDEEKNTALQVVADQTITYSRQDIVDAYSPFKKEEVHG